MLKLGFDRASAQVALEIPASVQRGVEEERIVGTWVTKRLKSWRTLEVSSSIKTEGIWAWHVYLF